MRRKRNIKKITPEHTLSVCFVDVYMLLKICQRTKHIKQQPLESWHGQWYKRKVGFSKENRNNKFRLLAFILTGQQYNKESSSPL